MTREELKQKFVPNVLDFGFVRHGDKIPFEVQNTSDMDILSHSKSCGCVGQVFSDAKTLKGEIEAKHSGGEDLYPVDGKYCTKHIVNGQPKFMDVVTNQMVNDPENIGIPVKVSMFNQSITVKMKQPGVPENVVGEGGLEIDNQEFMKIVIPVRMKVLPKE